MEERDPCPVWGGACISGLQANVEHAKMSIFQVLSAPHKGLSENRVYSQ